MRVGNLEAADLPVDSKDEIGILARSFRRDARGAAREGRARAVRRVADDDMGGERAETVVAAGDGRRRRGGAEPAVGQLFAGRYEIQGVLGRGGMGVVYRAHDRDLDDIVAIKTLRGEALSADPTLLDRFKQEIRLARRITHPNILRTHDLGETGGLRYLSMEFVKGLTLKQLVEAGDILPTPVGLRIAKQICAGLAAAHEVGVIHRDIKPQNIMIEPTGGLKIMDFGIARLKEERGMTAEGTVVGTPDYMSPEQARGTRSTFAPTSIRPASSCTRYSPGRCPSTATRRWRSFSSTSRRARPRLRRGTRGSIPRISQIILKCMQKDPKDRYQTVNDLYEALTRVTAQAA